MKAVSKIFFLPEAAEQFQQINILGLREKISHLVEGLTVDPSLGKPLQGPLTGHYVCEVGSYRIVYGMDSQKKEVTIERIAPISRKG